MVFIFSFDTHGFILCSYIFSSKRYFCHYFPYRIIITSSVSSLLGEILQNRNMVELSPFSLKTKKFFQIAHEGETK